jgi:hypothetical protein
MYIAYCFHFIILVQSLFYFWSLLVSCRIHRIYIYIIYTVSVYIYIYIYIYHDVGDVNHQNRESPLIIEYHDSVSE